MTAARLTMFPVNAADYAELVRLKGDPRVYAQMLGGVRSPAQVAAEMAEDAAFWARHGTGMWMVRDVRGTMTGLVGVHERVDGRGIALRFAITPESRGQGLARKAAGAALRHAHDEAGLPRIVAVARYANIGSRTVLGAVGMRECERFLRDGEAMVMFESTRQPPGRRVP